MRRSGAWCGGRIPVGEVFKVAIIGSGPAGMSAAGRAAQLGLSHVLLEKTDHLSDTIYKYQKGKHVMATPSNLVLRSDIDFDAGKREAILAVTIPERPGSFRAFCRLLGKRSVTEFNYRYADARIAHIFVGIEVANRRETEQLLGQLRQRRHPRWCQVDARCRAAGR